MFNFQNLNPTEFEVLSKDILELETGEKYRTYTTGKDGGIDIGSYEHDNTFAQVKHTMRTTFSTLITSLKKELIKVKRIQPKEYYLFISTRLTPSNTNEIYELFSDYMTSPKNIYDGVRIDDLLNSDKYSDIVHKHYKLWLVSTGVLEKTLNNNIFIDTEVLFDEINSETELFVDTKAYYDSLDILNKHHVLIIQGNPGVGKTTISKMLLLKYATEGYRVRYASSNSIRDIKNALSKDSKGKEIVLLDDFLGQHYLNISEERPNEIKALIAYINKHPSKRIILNTRITILKEAERKFQSFDSYMKKNESKKYIIDVDKISPIEKAQIFYNHLYFNHLPKAFYNEIVIDKRYLEVILHKNYNPRIIEFISSEYNYRSVPIDEYYKFVLDNLTNPHKIWEEEFEERIEEIDRIFMYCLYSISNEMIGLNTLREVFNYYIRNQSFDKSKDLFNSCIKRLSESMIKIVFKEGQTFLQVVNPSVNDYLYNKIGSSELILEYIVNHVLYYEQLNTLKVVNKSFMYRHITTLILENKYQSLNTLLYNTSLYYLSDINQLQLCDTKIEHQVHLSLKDKNMYKMIIQLRPNNWGLSNTIFEFLTTDIFYETYSLHKILFSIESMKWIISIASDENLICLNKYYETLHDERKVDLDIWKEFIDKYQVYISSYLSDYFEAEYYDEYIDVIDEIIGSFGDELDIDDLSSDLDNIADDVKELIIEEIRPSLKDKRINLHCGYLDLSIKIDIDALINDLEIKNSVESYYESRVDSYYDSSDFEGSYHSSFSHLDTSENTTEIDAMFHREYKD